MLKEYAMYFVCGGVDYPNGRLHARSAEEAEYHYRKICRSRPDDIVKAVEVVR